MLALVAAASFAVSLWWAATLPSWAFFSLPSRAWELAAGGLVALSSAWWRRLPGVVAAGGGIAGLALVVLGCVRLGESTPYPYAECERWRGEVLEDLRAHPPALVVLAMTRRYGSDFGFVSYDPAWLAGLTREVATLRSLGVPVLVLGPVPDPHS